MNSLAHLNSSVAMRITDAVRSTTAADLRDTLTLMILSMRDANIWRLEDFGGWGLDATNKIVTLNAPSATITVFGSGSGRRARIAGITGLSGLPFPDGQSVTVTGASNPANNGTFWVNSLSVGGAWVEVINPGAAAETGANVTISGPEVRANQQSYEFNANGTPNPGVVFDNRTALLALLQAARSQAAPYDPMSVIIDLGGKVYPISAGIDIKGTYNLLFRSVGRDQGGFLVTGGYTTLRPHFIYAIQGPGEPNTVTTAFHRMFILGDKNALGSSFDWGDLGRTGIGDLVHFDQKVGDDHTASSTQFPGRIGGVDPRIIIRDCNIMGAPRHNIYMRGRGDAIIDGNTMQNAGFNAMRLQLHDSKVKGNIVQACGESAVVCERGGNNVQFTDNHYYFNGLNHHGRMTTANTDDEILKALATVVVDFPNVKMRGDRIEDTAGPAMWLGKITNLEMDVDLNSIGSLGPTGSDREFIYSTLPAVSGVDWYGDAGVPAIIGDGAGDFCGIKAKILWRTGRAGQFVNRVLDFRAGASDAVMHDWEIAITPGTSQNATGRPTVDDPVWTPGAPQHFLGYYRMLESTRHQHLKDVQLTVRGAPCDDLHARRYRAAFMDHVNQFDRVVILSTAAPVRYSIASIAVSGTTATITVSGTMGSNDFLMYQAVEFSGCANAANNGRFRITSKNAAAKTITITNAAAVAEGAGGIAVAGSAGQAQLARKPVGTVTEYHAEAIGVNGTSDTASVAYLLPGGGTLFTLNTPGEVVVTKVGIDGVEAV